MSRPTAPFTETLDPDLLLRAYAMGLFPMADARTADGVFWVEPRQRAVLPLDGFRLSRRLRRRIASDCFRVTADQAFDQVIALCAEATADRPDTWINTSIEQVFRTLHRRGFAHSIEVWADDRLVGGLYGLALGRAFFGESMFSRATDASKVALAWLVARLRVGGFALLDCQFQTDHLASLGAVEIDRAAYSVLLAAALGDGVAGLLSGSAVVDGAFEALDDLRVGGVAGTTSVSAPVDGKVIAQLLGQTS
ncbi:leucyl/phenylalanyl-tRNA--protein transferase [Sphingomonas guangdongensis]|uniref:Leucyl/phenylalanyl-tRNA--protein transferase n=1 Tax=Sphingomonas guangdongensis TaxID=1141890 RepID=A0A285R2E5_9SPHN|nr:leucyl/phenylalanyl-tRNA--protein transferase [Sphingomonas guangdongensis]SOB88280.1 leucyl/phenylalanyl-tRNA--protein transferase [Sphingomonas guangdongensis]